MPFFIFLDLTFTLNLGEYRSVWAKQKPQFFFAESRKVNTDQGKHMVLNYFIRKLPQPRWYYYWEEKSPKKAGFLFQLLVGGGLQLWIISRNRKIAIKEQKEENKEKGQIDGKERAVDGKKLTKHQNYLEQTLRKNQNKKSEKGDNLVGSKPIAAAAIPASEKDPKNLKNIDVKKGPYICS